MLLKGRKIVQGDEAGSDGEDTSHLMLRGSPTWQALVSIPVSKRGSWCSRRHVEGTKQHASAVQKGFCSTAGN